MILDTEMFEKEKRKVIGVRQFGRHGIRVKRRRKYNTKKRVAGLGHVSLDLLRLSSNFFFIR